MIRLRRRFSGDSIISTTVLVRLLSCGGAGTGRTRTGTRRAGDGVGLRCIRRRLLFSLLLNLSVYSAAILLLYEGIPSLFLFNQNRTLI
jgi:hypothetical protein